VTMNTLKIGEISKELPIKNKMEEEDEGRWELEGMEAEVLFHDCIEGDVGFLSWVDKIYLALPIGFSRAGIGSKPSNFGQYQMPSRPGSVSKFHSRSRTVEFGIPRFGTFGIGRFRYGLASNRFRYGLCRRRWWWSWVAESLAFGVGRMTPSSFW
jgi:hypothetical protein